MVLLPIVTFLRTVVSSLGPQALVQLPVACSTVKQELSKSSYVQATGSWTRAWDRG